MTEQARRLPRPVERGRLGGFALLVAVGVGQALGAVGVALLVQRAFDGLVAAWATPEARDDPAGAAVTWMLGALGAAVLVAALCRAAERALAERVGQHYVQQVRDRLFEHLTRVPARALGRRSSGAMLQRFAGDLSALRTWVSLGLARLLVSGVAVALVLGALALLAPRVAVAVALALGIGGLATWAVGIGLARAARRARRRRARLSGEVAERLANVAVVQASGQERRERRRIDRKGAAVAAAMVRQARASGAARGVAEATAGAATIGVLVGGALDVRLDGVPPGAVVGALAVVGMLAQHVRDLGRVAEHAAGAAVAREAAQRFLDLPPLPDRAGAPPLPDGPGELVLRGLGVEPGLHDVSVRLPAGATAAVVGGNGAGKSTLASAVARLVDPDAGAVELDGADLRSVDLRSVRRAIGVVGPDLPLLRGSVDRNVRYRLPRASDEAVAAVAERCGVAALVEGLDDGWASDVGEGGRLLSAGQRTRVALARALLGEPRLLVLDEAEAHLDGPTRALLRRAVAEREGTTVVITHDPETIAAADVVWRLEGGRLVDARPPSEAADRPAAA